MNMGVCCPRGTPGLRLRGPECQPKRNVVPARISGKGGEKSRFTSLGVEKPLSPLELRGGAVPCWRCIGAPLADHLGRHPACNCREGSVLGQCSVSYAGGHRLSQLPARALYAAGCILYVGILNCGWRPGVTSDLMGRREYKASCGKRRSFRRAWRLERNTTRTSSADEVMSTVLASNTLLPVLAASFVVLTLVADAHNTGSNTGSNTDR